MTAKATARAMLAAKPARITLVAMGKNALDRTDEDEICALHIRNLLEGRPGDPAAARQTILAAGEVARFHDPARPWLYPEDVEIALDVDRFDFAIAIALEDGRPVGRMAR